MAHEGDHEHADHPGHFHERPLQRKRDFKLRSCCFDLSPHRGSVEAINASDSLHAKASPKVKEKEAALPLMKFAKCTSKYFFAIGTRARLQNFERVYG